MTAVASSTMYNYHWHVPWSTVLRGHEDKPSPQWILASFPWLGIFPAKVLSVFYTFWHFHGISVVFWVIFQISHPNTLSWNMEKVECCRNSIKGRVSWRQILCYFLATHSANSGLRAFKMYPNCAISANPVMYQKFQAMLSIHFILASMVFIWDSTTLMSFGIF